MPTYPLSLPSQVPATVTFRMINSVGGVRSPFTGAMQTQLWADAARWGFDFEYRTLLDATAKAAFEAFLASLSGRHGTVLVGDPAKRTPRGTWAGTPIADSTGSPTRNRARDTRLYVRGLTADQSGAGRQGDHVQIGTGTNARLHMLLEDLDADGSGEGNAEIWPPLRIDVADAAALIVFSPKGRFSLTVNTVEATRRPGGFLDVGTLQFEERL